MLSSRCDGEATCRRRLGESGSLLAWYSWSIRCRESRQEGLADETWRLAGLQKTVRRSAATEDGERVAIFSAHILELRLAQQQAL